MFAEVKRNLPVSGDEYNGQIVDKIRSAELDLTETADIIMPGKIVLVYDPETKKVNDSSTMKDPYITDAITLYCQMRIGNPPNYDKLERAYRELKGNLSRSTKYSFGPAEG